MSVLRWSCRENEFPADGGGVTYWQRRRDYVSALRDAMGDLEAEVVVNAQAPRTSARSPCTRSG